MISHVLLCYELLERHELDEAKKWNFPLRFWLVHQQTTYHHTGTIQFLCLVTSVSDNAVLVPNGLSPVYRGVAFVAKSIRGYNL